MGHQVFAKYSPLSFLSIHMRIAFHSFYSFLPASIWMRRCMCYAFLLGITYLSAFRESDTSLFRRRAAGRNKADMLREVRFIPIPFDCIGFAFVASAPSSDFIYMRYFLLSRPSCVRSPICLPQCISHRPARIYDKNLQVVLRGEKKVSFPLSLDAGRYALNISSAIWYPD